MFSRWGAFVYRHRRVVAVVALALELTLGLVQKLIDPLPTRSR